MWVFELLFSLLGILSFLSIGLVFDFYVLTRRKLDFNLAVFFGLGMGVVAVFQMLAAVLQISINSIFVYCITGLSIVIMFADPLLNKQLKRALLQSLGKLKGRNILFLATGIAALVLVAAITFSHTVWGFDAIDKWLAKAYAFWFDDGITRNNLHGYYLADDPNLWPITAAWFYHFLGRASEFWVQMIPFTALVCIVGDFARRVLKSGALGFFWMVMLVFSPFLWGAVVLENYSGNADLLLGLYFLLAFGAIFEKRFLYSAIFFGFGVLTKNDGIPALLGFCLLFPVFGFLTREKISKRPYIVALGFLFFNIAWKIYFSLNNRYLENNLLLVLQQRPIVEYTRYSLNAFREEFRFVARWGVGFLVIFFFLFTHFKAVFENKWFLFALILFGFQFAGYIAVFYVTHDDQATQIATSIFRLVLQVYPAMLLFAYELSVYKSRRESK